MPPALLIIPSEANVSAIIALLPIRKELIFQVNVKVVNKVTMGRKSRHCRDESDPLLEAYSSQIAATSSVRFYSSPLHDSTPSNHGHGNLMIDQDFPIKKQASNDSTDTSHSPPRKQDLGDSNRSSLRSLPRKKTGYRVHRVSYTAQNHVQVLFRMYGSSFPQVLPFCLANLLWAVVVLLLKEPHL